MTERNRTVPSAVSRRDLLRGAVGGAALAALPAAVHAAEEKPVTAEKVVTKGRINHSVCAWCYKMPLEQLAANAAAMGLKSVELIGPDQWPVIKKHGLVCAMTGSHGIAKGFNIKANHEECIAAVKKSVDACSEAGFPSVICFSDNRKGIPDDVGLETTVEGLKKVIGYAEQKKVNLCLEVLNSRVDMEMKGHPDYMCDHVEFAAEVCRQIASPRMTFLFDIYHIQIMQGDIITRIKKYHEYVGHYHTAGVPGRNEIDDTQELNYPAIMRAIAETKYTGYVGQEFIPTRDPMTSLREAVKRCDV